MAQNLIEKITQKVSLNIKDGQEVKSGEFVTIQPSYVMTHDNTSAVIPKFKNIGAKKVANPRQLVYTLDHNVQDTGEKNLAKYKAIEKFAADMNVDFYPAGHGIGHQIMCEEGYAWPGNFVVASDSHSNMYGGLGCLGTPIVRTDAAAVWATGKTWWQIPPVTRVELKGTLPKHVTGKDIIITLAGFFNKDEVLNHALEFYGEGIKELSIDQRLSIANMSTEWGALVALFPIDEITIDWLEKRLSRLGSDNHPRINKKNIEQLKNNPIAPDNDAYYLKHITLDLSTVSSHVSGPNSVKVMTSVSDISKKDIKINKAYLVSCVNSRVEDIAQAAEIVKGKKVADSVEFYIGAASKEVQEDCEKLGHWQALLDAGAIALPPGCGPCIGLGKGLLEENEIGISATNRNFKGRMGSPNAQAYLASPAVVAASAIAGKITQENKSSEVRINAVIKDNTSQKINTTTTLLEGFPAEISGRAIFCPSDNINTDGIYPGKYTYREDLTKKEMADVVMENYDPEFQKIAQNKDIILTGYNFGTGSSREQAATALKYFGIQLVIAGSYSQTYKRNAINNGFLLLECPSLIDELNSSKENQSLTQVLAGNIKITLLDNKIFFNNNSYDFKMPGPIAQELILKDGLENWVKENI